MGTRDPKPGRVRARPFVPKRDRTKIRDSCFDGDEISHAREIKNGSRWREETQNDRAD